MISINWDCFDKTPTYSAVVTFPDNTTVSIPASKISQSGSYMSQSTGASVVPIGYVVGRSFHFCIINENNEFGAYDWYGAVIVLTLDYGNSHTIVFEDLTVVEPPETLGLVLEMDALDNTWRLDKPWTSSLVYPATIYQMWEEIVTNCGIKHVNVSSSDFSVVVSEKPEAGYSCRDTLGYIAASVGRNFMVKHNGKLDCIILRLGGGANHNISQYMNLSAAINTITITGFQVEDEDGNTVMAGSEGYVIELEASPITKGNELSIVSALYTKYGGKTLRKYECSTYNYAKAEVFDSISVTDGTTTVRSIITDLTYNLGGGSTFGCPIETPKSMGQSFDPGTRAVIAARELVASERTARQTAEAALAQAIAAKSGLYETTETAQGGGTIYYLHDKSTLAESTNVIKLTSEALGLSTDGGQTYPVGIMINGDVIARILSADGISADWITTGTLVVKDDNYNILFQANINTGYVYIDGMRVDNGMVTLGAAGSAKYMRVSDSGVEIIDRGVTTAKFSDHGAQFPGKVNFDGSIVMGNYQVITRYDGGVRVVRYFEY